MKENPSELIMSWESPGIRGWGPTHRSQFGGNHVGVLGQYKLQSLCFEKWDNNEKSWETSESFLCVCLIPWGVPAFCFSSKDIFIFTLNTPSVIFLQPHYDILLHAGATEIFLSLGTKIGDEQKSELQAITLLVQPVWYLGSHWVITLLTSLAAGHWWLFVAYTWPGEWGLLWSGL